MNVTVRKLKREHVMLIDERAKEKGMSRQKYLKNYLEKLGTSTVLNYEKQKLENQMQEVNHNLALLNQRLEIMDKHIELILLSLKGG